jgi:hypothetical protein
MEEPEYPLRHFQLMVQLAGDLRSLPAQILEHGYRYDAFGSWWTTLRRHGTAFRIVFDGKERQLRLERASSTAEADTWEELSSWRTNDPDAAHSLPDVVARLRVSNREDR